METQNDEYLEESLPQCNTQIAEYDTLVISGGSMNGLGILGALQYLKDSGKIDNVKNYVGTSAGAIICYFLIIGYTPIEIMVYICTHHKLFDNLKNINFLRATRGEGVLSFALISDILEKMTIDKIGKPLLLSALKEKFGKSLTCTTFNLTKNCCEYVNDLTDPDMPCLSALHMSCNIPVVFEPYKYGDNLYVDGGISNNFPIDIGEILGSKLIALSVDIMEPIQFGNMNVVEYMYKLLSLLVHECYKEKLKHKLQSTDVIEVKAGDKAIKMFDFDINTKIKLDLFSIGYDTAKQYYENIN